MTGPGCRAAAIYTFCSPTALAPRLQARSERSRRAESIYSSSPTAGAGHLLRQN